VSFSQRAKQAASAGVRGVSTAVFFSPPNWAEDRGAPYSQIESAAARPATAPPAAAQDGLDRASEVSGHDVPVSAQEDPEAEEEPTEDVEEDEEAEEEEEAEDAEEAEDGDGERRAVQTHARSFPPPAGPDISRSLAVQRAL